MDHGAAGLFEAGLADVVAGLLAVDYLADVGGEGVVCGSALHAACQVVVGLGEEAGADFAVGGEADAGAVAAEGFARRGR